MKRLLQTVLLAAVCITASAQYIPDDPAFRVGRLDNGMTYYLYHNENPAGVAEFYIIHNVGALQEEDTYQRNNGGLIYFSIMLGTNDSACSGTEGAPVSPDTYGTNIKKIIDALIAGVPDCKILLNYPIWYSPSTHNGARYLQEGLDRLHSYYPILDAIVEEYDQVYAGDRAVWDYFEDNKVLFTSENGNSGTFYLHPNQYGATRLAEVWAHSLLQLIEADGVEIKNPLPEWELFKPSNDKK